MQHISMIITPSAYVSNASGNLLHVGGSRRGTWQDLTNFVLPACMCRSHHWRTLERMQNHGRVGRPSGTDVPCMHAPQAFSNTLKRMLEAAGRGMWQADAATLDKLQSMYADIGDELEGVR